MNIFENILNNYSNQAVPLDTILSLLLVVLGLSIYEFFVYRYVSHRAFYNKSFNISIAILPFFISTIIVCLQTNVIITLGAVGALAMIRFRTAVKDPVDMIYILWSIYIGVIAGCMLYEVAIVTSLIVTILLVILERLSKGKKPYILIIHSKDDLDFNSILKPLTKRFRIKSRNYTSNGVDYAIEVSIKDLSLLTDSLKKNKLVSKFSLIEFDADDIV